MDLRSGVGALWAGTAARSPIFSAGFAMKWFPCRRRMRPRHQHRKGGVGTNSRGQVGRTVRLAPRCWKSRMKSLTTWVTRTRFAEAVAKACCSKINEPRLPGRAGSMLRSSPKSCCQHWRVRRRAPRAPVRRAWSFSHQ